jgi:DNA-binding NarL/FixJ family response regulator
MNTSLQKDSESYTVWIVEDDHKYGTQLSRLINMSGVFYCEKVFRSCESALSDLRDDIPPDILLMDVGLPGMDGIEGVRRVREIAPVVQIVMLTVYEDSDSIFRAIGAGAAGYLSKGSSLEAIVESLKIILGGGAPINPHIAKKVLELFASISSPGTDYGLTVREKQVLALLVDGLTKKQIGERLFVSYNTIGKHVRNIYLKLQVQTRGSAIAKTLRERLL